MICNHAVAVVHNMYALESIQHRLNKFHLLPNKTMINSYAVFNDRKDELKEFKIADILK